MSKGHSLPRLFSGRIPFHSTPRLSFSPPTSYLLPPTSYLLPLTSYLLPPTSSHPLASPPVPSRNRRFKTPRMPPIVDPGAPDCLHFVKRERRMNSKIKEEKRKRICRPFLPPCVSCNLLRQNPVFRSQFPVENYCTSIRIPGKSREEISWYWHSPTRLPPLRPDEVLSPVCCSAVWLIGFSKCLQCRH